MAELGQGLLFWLGMCRNVRYLHLGGSVLIGVCLAASISVAQTREELPKEVVEILTEPIPNDTSMQSLIKQDPSFSKIQLTLAEMFGIPPDSPELARLTDSGIKELPPVKELPSKVVSHTVIEGGVKFPDPASVQLPRLSSEQQRMLQEAVLQKQADILELQKLALQRWGEPKPMRRCEVGKTEKYEYQADAPPDVMFDLLMIGRKPPLNPEELFGKSVRVLQYRSDKRDPLSAAIHGAGTPCLPYRIRFVGGTRFEHQGEDALRNFEEDPMGRGKVNSKLRSVIREFE